MVKSEIISIQYNHILAGWIAISSSSILVDYKYNKFGHAER